MHTLRVLWCMQCVLVASVNGAKWCACVCVVCGICSVVILRQIRRHYLLWFWCYVILIWCVNET